MFRFNPFKSMTIQGAVAAVTPFILGAFDVTAFSPQASTIVTGLGVLWSVLGLRNAVSREAGSAVADLAERLLAKGAGR